MLVEGHGMVSACFSSPLERICLSPTRTYFLQQPFLFAAAFVLLSCYFKWRKESDISQRIFQGRMSFWRRNTILEAGVMGKTLRMSGWGPVLQTVSELSLDLRSHIGVTAGSSCCLSSGLASCSCAWDEDPSDWPHHGVGDWWICSSWLGLTQT